MTHAEHIEDPNSGDLIDINYFCSGQCYTLSPGGDAYGHAWPGGSETDYDVMCHHCGTLLWRGLSSPRKISFLCNDCGVRDNAVSNGTFQWNYDTQRWEENSQWGRPFCGMCESESLEEETIQS